MTGDDRQQLWTAVDRWFDAALLPVDPVLDAVLRASTAAGLPAIAVSPSQGRLLALLVQAVGARRILELGTLGAYSTIWMARAMAEGGLLTSIEAMPHHADIARANIGTAGLSGRVDIRVGKALDVLPVLAAEKAGPFDFAFIDADKANIPDYFFWTLRMSRPGTLIVVDNVVRDGAVVDPSNSSPDVEGVRRFAAMLTAEPRVSATAIQTVGVKGYDGFLLARDLA